MSCLHFSMFVVIVTLISFKNTPSSSTQGSVTLKQESTVSFCKTCKIQKKFGFYKSSRICCKSSRTVSRTKKLPELSQRQR